MPTPSAIDFNAHPSVQQTKKFYAEQLKRAIEHLVQEERVKHAHHLREMERTLLAQSALPPTRVQDMTDKLINRMRAALAEIKRDQTEEVRLRAALEAQHQEEQRVREECAQLQFELNVLRMKAGQLRAPQAIPGIKQEEID